MAKEGEKKRREGELDGDKLDIYHKPNTPTLSVSTQMYCILVVLGRVLETRV